MCVWSQKMKNWCAVVARAASGVSQDVLTCKTFRYLGCWWPRKAFNSQFKDVALWRRGRCREGEQTPVGEMIFLSGMLVTDVFHQISSPAPSSPSILAFLKVSCLLCVFLLFWHVFTVRLTKWWFSLCVHPLAPPPIMCQCWMFGSRVTPSKWGLRGPLSFTHTYKIAHLKTCNDNWFCVCESIMDSAVTLHGTSALSCWGQYYLQDFSYTMWFLFSHSTCFH